MIPNKKKFFLNDRLFDKLRFVKTLSLNPEQRKHLLRWIKISNVKSLINNAIPWITFDGIDYLNNWIVSKKITHIFEYGSGGSTLFWEKTNADLISIEHDQTWHEYILKKIRNPSKIDYRLIMPEKYKSDPNVSLDPSNPHNYISTDVNYSGYSFRNYVKQIDQFPDSFFDIILIDGRSRPSCILHSASKVRQGGLLILDNSDRKYYFEQTIAVLRNFDSIDFYGSGPINNYFWGTMFFTPKM